MSVVSYVAIIERGERSGYGVFFPDLPGLVSAGDDLEEAARNAEEGLRGHLALMVEEGLDLPAPRPLDAIEIDPDIDEAARILVRAEVPPRARTGLPA